MLTTKLAWFAPLLLVAATAFAQNPTVKIKEEKPGMLKQVKIAPETAIKTAQREVPNGKIRSAELEREDGHLMYSFDIKVAGKSGIEEINIDAATGKLLAHEHEGPAKERAESRAERKEAASSKTKH